MNFCQNCGEKLNENANFCGACGAKILCVEPDSAIQIQQNEKKSVLCSKCNSELRSDGICPKCSKKYNVIILSTLGIFVFACLLHLCSLEEDPNKFKRRNNSIEAYIMSEKFVRDRLKSPSSAVFPSAWKEKDRGAIIQVGNDGYMIKSYVESQNSFGVMIRTEFVAILKQVSNSRWELVKLEFVK